MAFDPSQPFEIVEEPEAQATGFDPSQPFEVVTDEAPPVAQASGFDPSQPFEIVDMAAEQVAREFGPVPGAVSVPRDPAAEVEFTGKDAAFRVTGGMVADPTTGQVQPSGAIVFDQSSPERLSQGIEEAWKAGAIDGERYAKLKEMQAPVLKVLEDRRKLQAKAATDPQLAAFLQGAGRGGAATLGAIGGAKMLGAVGAAGGMAVAGPPGAAVGGLVLGTAGAIGGGIAGGLGMEQVQKFLGKHFEEYDNALKAAELYPLETTAGQLALALPAAGVSVAQGARALATTASGAGGMPAAVRQGAAALGLGAGTGAAATAADALVRGEAVTPEALAVGAAGGAAMGGFFLNPGVARTADVANVLGKVRAGQALTAEEAAVAQAVGAARPQGRAQLAAAEQAGGQQVRMDVEVPTASVAGMMPAAGRARVSTEFYVPPKLPEAAVLRLQAGRQAPERTTGPVVPTGETIVPRTMSRGQLPEMTGMRVAPVTVLPTGEERIVPPPIGAPSPATMSPINYVEAVAETRGIPVFAPEEETALLDEHFQQVKDAVARREPVSAAALDMYEMRVPFYSRDEQTGVAQFDEGLFEEHFRLLAESQRADAEQAQDGGVELLKAVLDAGGLPSPRSGRDKAIWTGELRSLYETASAAGRGKGADNQVGIFLPKLFRKDAPDLDKMVLALQAKGFRVNSEAELIELLDNRLRSGREVFAYGELSNDPMELAGRRPRGPAPGAPRQMDLLGQDEGGFALVSEVDRTSLTPEEMALRARKAERKAEADAAQGDLFGMEQASGGGAQVPPGQPVGMAAMGPPDWVLKPGETSEGRRLIKGIANFKPGQQWGFRSIVDLLNRAVQVEMRRSRSQTKTRNPAHYRPANHLVFTRDSQSQINFHEAGHGLQYLLLAREPEVLKPHAAELMGLVNRPGSMASEPPTSASEAQKQAYRLGEGVAEWLRLRMMEPAAVERLAVTKALEAAAERHYPGITAALRDGARAVNAFNQQPVAVRWQMFNTAGTAPVGANELLGAVVRGGESLARLLASGSPLSKLDRRMFRAIVKNREQVGMTYKQAVAAARRVRSQATEPLMNAYNMILSLGQEVQLAISGQGPSKGLRVVGPDGNLQYFSKAAWVDLRRRVPAGKLAQFDAAAWALESLERWEADKLEYPGMREGITPDDLRAIVQQAQRDIPGFGQLFVEQMNFQNALLAIKEYGGLVSAEEAAKIRGARETYWPLPRHVEGVARTAGGRGGADMNAGLFRARGGSDAIRQIDEVTEERTRQALEAYYWNRMGNTMVDRLAKVAKDRRLPIEARAMAGQMMTPMKMPQKVAATVSREEALGWVLESIKDAMETATGIRPEITAEDVNLSWNFRDVWRPTKPGDANVVSLLRDGERMFYQVGDPAVFGMFAAPQVASNAGRFVAWAVGPMTQNWKRAITQGTVFALRNLFRDTFTQTVLNPDPVGWVPGWSHFRGVVNKFTRKYPQVMQEGLLLSRIQPTDTELVQSVKHGAVWQWFMEGLYVSQAKDPVVRLLATVLQPSNWLFPLWKTADVVNLVGPGAVVGFGVGGPVGAAVGAVAGPLVGFSGPQIAQFFETAGREGAAVSVLRRGGTDEEALAKYWSAAGQFNEHSGIPDARIAMSIQGFTNPMFQGTRNAMQRLTDPDPKVRGTAWTRLLVMMPLTFGGAATMAYLMMSDRQRDKERQRPVDQRMNFMDLGGLSVPFPFGPEGAMASMIYNATLDDLLGRPKVDAERSAWTLLKKVGGDVSPLQVFGPQLATLLEARMNFSEFQQRNIVSPWMINLPASEQYYSTTPEFYREMGKMFDYSPAKLQYIVQQGISRQLDEVLRMVESVDRGRPVQEDADVPFVGRLFTRDPIGFNSQAVRSAAAVEERLQLLDTRLNANGWGWLKGAAPDELRGLPDERLRALGVQLAVLQSLRRGLRSLDEQSELAKYFALKGDYAAERNIRAAQVLRAQAVLTHNEPLVGRIDTALELLNQIGPASRDAQAADYWRRAR